VEVLATTGDMTCKAPVKLSPPTNQHNLLRAVSPSRHPLKEKPNTTNF